MAGWYKPTGAKLFHAFKDGVSRCGAWEITRPLQRLKKTDPGRCLCGKCFDAQLYDIADRTFAAIEEARMKMPPEKRRKADRAAKRILEKALA